MEVPLNLKNDLSEKSYWDSFYTRSRGGSFDLTDSSSKRIDELLSALISVIPGKARVLEIGCGGSQWLPRLAMHDNVQVHGLDISSPGCQLARQALEDAGAMGTITEGDLFNPPREMAESFDMVFSMGVAEHFRDTSACMKAMSGFLKPGGVIFTLIPNLSGTIGTLQRMMDRKIFDIHVPLTREHLSQAVKASALQELHCDYFMNVGFGIVNISSIPVKSPGWYLRKALLSPLARLSPLASKLCTNAGKPAGRAFSPYIISIARKSGGDSRLQFRLPVASSASGISIAHEDSVQTAIGTIKNQVAMNSVASDPDTHDPETIGGPRRFAFGKNWQSFVEGLSENRISEAVKGLKTSLGADSLAGKTFLDAGCGSGLTSLAARRLGATVVSFDYDPDSVQACQRTRLAFCPEDAHDSDDAHDTNDSNDSNGSNGSNGSNDPDLSCTSADPAGKWKILQGSVLDRNFMASLGKFDIVCSWGVLHHTGSMWEALENILIPMSPKGALFIAIYNDQGIHSEIWKKVKALYGQVPVPLRCIYTAAVMAPSEFKALISMMLRLGPVKGVKEYIDLWKNYESFRGMSRWHDLVDWAGGYPFEVASPDQIFTFYHSRGLSLDFLKTCGGGLGCNEFLFRSGR